MITYLPFAILIGLSILFTGCGSGSGGGRTGSMTVEMAKTATIVDPSSIFQVALLANATSIIAAHNHPSGNLDPSKSDKNLPKRIK